MSLLKNIPMVRWLCLLAFCTMASPLLHAAPPAWWANGVIDPNKQANDYAAVNQGQLKNIATQAAAELDANLPGGAGDDVDDFVSNWATPTPQSNDFAPVNLGMLKTVAQHFYDRLIAVGYTNVYPWNADQSSVNNYAAANIGQVKNLFSFDVTYDSDGDSLPDWWEMHWFGQLGVNPNSLAARGDGLTILQAFEQGLNPNDYYNGQAFSLAVVSGTPQTGPPNGFVPLPLIVSVTDADNNPFGGAPVTFMVSQGGGQMQTSSSAAAATSITVLTDSSGQAEVFFQLPNTLNSTSQITATTGSDSQAMSEIFEVSSDDGSGSYGSPFDPSNVVASGNADGSGVVTWTNNADPTDQTPIDVQYMDANGNWVTLATVSAGTTSYQIPAQ